MEGLLSIDAHGDASKYSDVFLEVTRRLEVAGIDYAFAGTLALDMYVRPRFTDEIEVFCRTVDLGQAERLVASISKGEHATKICIRLGANSRPGHLHALANSRQLALFGTLARFASPLSLAWNLLESTAPYADHDVSQLLIQKVVGADELKRLLDLHSSAQATERLAEIINRLDRERSTYNDSVKARLARRRL